MKIYCVTYENGEDIHIELITTDYDEAMIRISILPREYEYGILTTWENGEEIKSMRFDRSVE